MRTSTQSAASLLDPVPIVRYPRQRSLRAIRLERAGFCPLMIDLLERLGRRRRLYEGDTLYRRGDRASELFAVLSGRVKLLSHAGDGRRLAFQILGVGDLVGEIELFDRRSRLTTAVAIDNVELLAVQRRDLRAALRTNPDLCEDVILQMATRMRYMSGLCEDALFLAIPARLARRLLILAERWGATNPDGTALQLPVSQQDLGDLIGATRESVNKHLRDWTRRGFITRHDGTITVTDETALRLIARAHPDA